MESGVFLLFAFFDRGNMAHWGGPVQRYTLELRLFSFWHPSNIFPLAHTHWLSGLVGGWPQMRFGSSQSGCELPLLHSDNLCRYILVSLSVTAAWIFFCIYHAYLILFAATAEDVTRVVD